MHNSGTALGKEEVSFQRNHSGGNRHGIGIDPMQTGRESGTRSKPHTPISLKQMLDDGN